MEARYNRLKKAGQLQAAEQFLLSDPEDKSSYLTVQNYNDNSVNVCLDSSYAFIDKVVYELQQMYRQAGLQLSTYHMGGDEVGVGSWQKSPACQALMAKGLPGLSGVSDLKPYFVGRVAALLQKRRLVLGGWEDGLMYDANTPFNRGEFANDKVYANVWDNIWEWGVADRAYRLANAGYQVVLSHGTHLYLDHPNEVAAEERGYYWASRFTDAQKIFGYMPDHLYANADKTLAGEPISNLEALLGRALPKLEQPQNILGIQGQVWSETIRTAEQLRTNGLSAVVTYR
ncbi:MAG: family 20 glycosylhydrolase [Rheinheimera sp.]|nr:family 20 glycosylhydrolase [Rheinheimera sp.]